jgi:hypothetical protein
MKTPNFRQCMEMMRGKDPQVQEDGFHCLLDQASEYSAELISEFEAEKDHGLKCWLLELVAHARSPSAFTLFEQHLYGEDQSLRTWAAYGLWKLNNKEAKRLLWEAESHRFAISEETDEFRAMLQHIREWK